MNTELYDSKRGYNSSPRACVRACVCVCDVMTTEEQRLHCFIQRISYINVPIKFIKLVTRPTYTTLCKIINSAPCTHFVFVIPTKKKHLLSFLHNVNRQVCLKEPDFVHYEVWTGALYIHIKVSLQTVKNICGAILASAERVREEMIRIQLSPISGLSATLKPGGRTNTNP